MRRPGLSFSRMGAVLLLAGLCHPVSGQAPNQTKYPQGQLQTYQSFFFRFTWLDEQADRLASQGKNPTYARSLIRKQAGLTLQEEAALRNIAADWKVQNSGIASAARALMVAGARVGTSQPLMALRNQRDQMVADHIDRLVAALGSARFSILDAFAQKPPATAGAPIKRQIGPPPQPAPGR